MKVTLCDVCGKKLDGVWRIPNDDREFCYECMVQVKAPVGTR